MKIDYREIGKRFKQIRRLELKLTQQELKGAIGYKTAIPISYIESSDRIKSIKFKAIAAICDLAGINLNWFVYGVGNKYITEEDKKLVELKSDNVDKYNNKKMLKSKNPRWSGGKSYFQNHYQLKLNRLEKLKQTGGKCEICGDDGNQVFHKDGNNLNHVISNLQVMCYKHISMLRKGTKSRTSKYRRLFGKTIEEIAKENGVSIGYANQLVRQFLKTKYNGKHKPIKEPLIDFSKYIKELKNEKNKSNKFP